MVLELVAEKSETGCSHLADSQLPTQPSPSAHSRSWMNFSSSRQTCSMLVLNSAIEASNELPPEGVAYLPDMQHLECDENSEDVVVVLQKILGKTADNASNYFKWHENRITLGKYLVKAGVELEAYATSGEEFPPPRPMRVDPRVDHWSRHLSCSSNTGAWQCLFGERVHNQNSSLGCFNHQQLAAGEVIWSKRRCLGNQTCGYGQNKYLSILFRGWLLHMEVPFDACELGLRDRCASATVLSIRNIQSEPEKRVFVSIHIRMGDACDRVVKEPLAKPWRWSEGIGRPCIAPAGYSEALHEVTLRYNVTDILLASDSPDAIVWAKSLVYAYDIHFVDSDRSRISEKRLGWIENRNDIGTAEVEGALQALDLLAGGHVFIGCGGSHFARSIYSVMVGRRNMVVPWISVDGHPIA